MSLFYERLKLKNKNYCDGKIAFLFTTNLLSWIKTESYAAIIVSIIVSPSSLFNEQKMLVDSTV